MGRIRVFAGPNGSGKSTLFSKIQNKFNTGAFINADLLEQQIIRSGLIDLNDYGIKATIEDFENFKKNPSAQSLLKKAASENLEIDLTLSENYLVDKTKESHSYESAFAAQFIRNQLLIKDRTFSYETVMSHPSKIEELQMAKDLGFKTYLYFVCTENPLVNIDRVENRIEKGGHAVNEDRIKSRYTKSLEQLLPALKIAYRSYLFDNSGRKMELIAEAYNQNLKFSTENIPNWVYEYVIDRINIEEPI